MISMKLNTAKSFFFDRKLVMDKVSAAERKVFSKAGAYIMRTARGLIRTDKRKKQKPSEPGKPPKSRTGKLRDNIFFLWDPSTRSCVVGPILINGGTGAPEILEKGGTVRLSRISKKGKTTQTTARIEARPYMGPSLDKNKEKLGGLWENAVKP